MYIKPLFRQTLNKLLYNKYKHILHILESDKTEKMLRILSKNVTIQENLITENINICQFSVFTKVLINSKCNILIFWGGFLKQFFGGRGGGHNMETQYKRSTAT